jgi:hypothetical protein
MHKRIKIKETTQLSLKKSEINPGHRGQLFEEEALEVMKGQ